MNRIVNFICEYPLEILGNFLYSIGYLILLPTIIAIIIAIPCSILVARNKKFRFIMQIFNFLNTIPAMIMFVILIILHCGLGLKPSLIALILYAIIPIMVSTVPSLESIDNSKGIALGMNWWQKIICIDIPMASPSIITGIKLAMIYGVSNSILCASIGANGLGKYVMLGLSQMRLDYQVVGSVPLIMLAIIFETVGSYFSSKMAKMIKQEI